MDIDDGLLSLSVLFLWSDHALPTFILRSYFPTLGGHELGSLMSSSLILLLDWHLAPLPLLLPLQVILGTWLMEAPITGVRRSQLNQLRRTPFRCCKKEKGTQRRRLPSQWSPPLTQRSHSWQKETGRRCQKQQFLTVGVWPISGTVSFSSSLKPETLLLLLILVMGASICQATMVSATLLNP